MKSSNLKAHLALLFAASMWGLMAPIGKAAMEAGISGLALANMRMIGGAVCFWITSLFVRKEEVPPRDLMLLFFASMLGIVCNQGCYTFGLSLTSPVDASIMTTTMPIVTMILAAIFLKEPVTPLKVGGILLGSVGALALILSNAGGSEKEGSVLGDVLCVTAQWMFSYAAICFIPFSYRDFSEMQFAEIPMEVWMQIGYVILFGTYFAYILMLVGQKTLRPTVVSMYNYMQPVVGSSVAIMMGMSSFGWVKAIAAISIFAGVYLVTQSKSRAEMLKEESSSK